MAEQSHRAEMSAAIRAQRERAGLPRHPSAPEPDEGETENSPALEGSPTEAAKARPPFVTRLLRRSQSS